MSVEFKPMLLAKEKEAVRGAVKGVDDVKNIISTLKQRFAQDGNLKACEDMDVLFFSADSLQENIKYYLGEK